MQGKMRRRASPGFTLLEVLIATAIMAVGTTSVLVVIATAAGMASKRQIDLRREQVLDEARHVAQAKVDEFHPAPGPTTTKVQVISTNSKNAAPAANAGKHAPDKIVGAKSERYDGFTYDVTFAAKDPLVPEMGFDVDVTLHYGGGELSYSAPTTSMIGKTIPDFEFERSATYVEEQSAPTDAGKANEKGKRK